ncbi:MAG: hypothetical protein R3C32_13340 [Chloroflexota bacterium]
MWQDLPFACAAYPRTRTWSRTSRARSAMRWRVSGPTPAAVWNSSNECVWGWFDWDWREPLAGRPWGLGYYLDVLPRLLAELDPDRPYQPSSPWSGDMAVHPTTTAMARRISGTSGTSSTTRRTVPSAPVRARVRLSGPAHATLRAALGPDGMWLDSLRCWRTRRPWAGRPSCGAVSTAGSRASTTSTSGKFLAQLEQAQALRVGMQPHLRCVAETCQGSVVWQLNDCWPAISWSIVDVAERRKLAWFAVRDAYRDRLATFALGPEGAASTDARRPRVALVNDHAEPWVARGEVRRVGIDGRVHERMALEVPVGPRAAASVALPAGLVTPGDPRAELLVLDVGGARDLWWFVDDPDVATGPPELDVRVAPADDGALVEVAARTLARELCLLVDHVIPDATVDRALVTLLPGERATFRVVTSAPVPDGLLEALGRRPALRAANDRPMPAS